MNDKLLAWIRVAVVSTIGASITAAVSPYIPKEFLSEFVNAIQLLVTVACYVAITQAAQKWPIINRIISLFMSSNSPKFSK